jgi:multiple sugar transport system substrate-binding protein
VVPTINTVDAGTYLDSIKQYLDGTPDDVVQWYAGYRINHFANQGLLTNISDVWASVDSQFSSAYKTASTASDGKQYLLPLFSYPWVVIYRKSVFVANGYTVPKTLDEFVTLAGKMKSDGLVALAFGDKDGWPAMGTFDILDMRMNGYDFHIRLLAGQEKWTDPKVKAVFSQWAKLLPISQPNAVGQVWQQAAQLLFDKKAGMYFIGSFATNAATSVVQADLAFFPFPVFGNQYDSENAIDAPVDGLMLSKSPSNLAADKTLLECLATGPAELAFLNSNSGWVGANSNADTSRYSDFQKQMATITAGSNRIAQFLDRDTRPDFAGANGMQQFLMDFLTKPNQDLAAYLKKIQTYWDALPPYSG